MRGLCGTDSSHESLQLKVKYDIGLERIVNIKLGFQSIYFGYVENGWKSHHLHSMDLDNSTLTHTKLKEYTFGEEHFKNTNTNIFIFKTTCFPKVCSYF
jgi:hypothetical protein